MENNKDNNKTERSCKFRRDLSVDIEFQDLSYSVQNVVSKTRTTILKSINGKYHSGELIGIMGSSGSGKTTLLNILSGYTSKNVTGNILVNGKPRDMKVFHKISGYIMQEDLLQEHLSVEELMFIAATLKMGDAIALQKKKEKVLKVLNLLGLSNCLTTWTECLSGGERKRLSIALEMVSSPSVIFLDEPTSGLDSVSIRHCMQVLKLLSGQGTTVICTVHQPTTTTLQSFNQVYFLHDGLCIYNGDPSNIVPFMTSLNYECPITYNPSDFIIETTHMIDDSVSRLVSIIQNGRVNIRKLQLSSSLGTHSIDDIDNTSLPFIKKPPDIDFSATFWTQFITVYKKMMTQITRNKFVLSIFTVYHLVVAVGFGLQFYQVGNNATLAPSNVKLGVAMILFFTYTYFQTVLLFFPFEVRLLKREYFNRWYGLKPYYLALSLRNLPLMVVLGIPFVMIVYLLTDQPLEIDRFVRFTTVCILTGYASEALAIAIASLCSATTAAILGPLILAPMVLLCIYEVATELHPVMKVLTHTSYLRSSVIAICLSMYDDRRPLKCNEIFCYYQYPQRILKISGMLNSSYSLHVIGLIAYIMLFRLLAVVSLRFRLTSELSRLIAYYTSKRLQFS